VEGMFDTKMGLQSFKMHMRDFLIQLKEFSTEDNAGLFGEENETEAQKREESLRQQRQAVPGLFKPDEMADDDF
jgi:exportin-1